MAYIRPGSGTVYQSGVNIGLTVNVPNSPFGGNAFMFPYEKMKIYESPLGPTISLLDYSGKLYGIFSPNYSHSEEYIRDYYKTYPDNHVAYYYMSIYNKQAKHLLRAIELLEESGRNRFKDEIRQLRARIDSGNLEAKVGNYPNISPFDSKINRDLTRTARIELDRYNETTYNFGVFARIISDRKIDPNRLALAAPAGESDYQIDQEAIDELQNSLERQKNSGTQTYWILGFFALVILIKRRNAKG